MTAAHALWIFAGAAGVLTITPGLDTALVLETAATTGPRAALAAGLGICLGCLAWGLAVAFGLAVWLMASPRTYACLRYGAATYLVVLAVKLWRERPTPDATREEGGAALGRGAFRRGLFTNLLNPKVGLFYVSFLPLFIPPGVSPGRFTVLLASIHALEGLAWFAMLAMATQLVSAWLAERRVRHVLSRATAVVFLGAAWRLVRDP
jgi:threonine/homoserine/homoserine lactone efflux protein